MEARGKYKSRWKRVEDRIIIAENAIIRDNHLQQIDPVVINFGEDDDDDDDDYEGHTHETTERPVHSEEPVTTDQPIPTDQPVTLSALPPELLPLDFEYLPVDDDEEMECDVTASVDVTGVSSDLAAEE